jgi:hypothetical protein
VVVAADGSLKHDHDGDMGAAAFVALGNARTGRQCGCQCLVQRLDDVSPTLTASDGNSPGPCVLFRVYPLCSLTQAAPESSTDTLNWIAKGRVQQHLTLECLVGRIIERVTCVGGLDFDQLHTSSNRVRLLQAD